MAEADQRRTVRRALKAYHPIPVENRVAWPGTPDLNCTLGWIELKWLRAWPTREYTIVRIDHYTRQQRHFLRDRWVAEGGAWLLLQRHHEWLLFTGDVAARLVGRATRAELYEATCGYWNKGLKGEELAECLRTTRTHI